MSVPIGPYMNEDGDWWVPVEVDGKRIAKKWAREEIIGCIQYSIPEEGTLIYVGQEMAWLDSEHEGHWDPEDEPCPTNYYVRAWHFRENPKPWA